MNPTVELVLKHKKANMRKSDFLMLEALKSAPHLNDSCYEPIRIVWAPAVVDGCRFGIQFRRRASESWKT